MKFKHFQAPVLFSSTFKALNLGEKIKYFQGLSRMCGNPDERTHKRQNLNKNIKKISKSD